MDTSQRQAIRSLAQAHRDLAQAYERLLHAHGEELQVDAARTSGLGAEPAATPLWDPEHDAPLLPPKVLGTRDEQDWCTLTYLGGIFAINKRYGRGANREEVRHYAMKAGYQDGRAVTAWSKGEGATQNDHDKQRWLTQTGWSYWMTRLPARLGVCLPPDLSEEWQAPDFSS